MLLGHRTFSAKTRKVMSKQTPTGHPAHCFKLRSKEWYPKFPKQIIIISVILVLKHENYRTCETRNKRRKGRGRKRNLKSSIIPSLGDYSRQVHQETLLGAQGHALYMDHSINSASLALCNTSTPTTASPLLCTKGSIRKFYGRTWYVGACW